MGNLCSKESSDPFDQPGRTLGSAPPRSSNPRAAVPSTAAAAKSPGRTLGGANPRSGASSNDPRSAAAKAAEARASQASKPKGKLGRELARDKSRTMSGTLGVASQDERRRRDVDQAFEARNYN